MGKKRRKRRR